MYYGPTGVFPTQHSSDSSHPFQELGGKGTIKILDISRIRLKGTVKILDISRIRLKGDHQDFGYFKN